MIGEISPSQSSIAAEAEPIGSTPYTPLNNGTRKTSNKTTAFRLCIVIPLCIGYVVGS
jgi:hypothetical protein